MSTHPSFLALDRLALGAGGDDARAHVEQCDECRAHLTRVSVSATMPASVKPARARRSWPFALAFSVVASFALVLVVSQDDGVSLRAKGHPSVAVFVKRADEVFMWDGKALLRVGDRVQLMIEPAGMRYVYVRDLEGKAMYGGPLETKMTTLPLSWRIEREGAAEHFTVVLAPGPLREDEIVARKDLVRQDIVLSKEALP